MLSLHIALDWKKFHQKFFLQAFNLLSHEAKYPPLVQLTLDMLSRLGTAAEEIVEILIARNLVVEAIRSEMFLFH